VPWKVSHLMSERMEFVTRLSKGERMTDLCEELGISRKTGYKFWRRYQEQGVRGLEDASRAPKRVARRTSPEIEELLVKARRRKMNWGGKKLKEVLEYRQPGLKLPSASTIAAILKRRGLVSGRKRRRVPEAYSGALTQPEAPNEVWGVDYKGQFRLGNGRYCYPLTATDLCSRYVLVTEALDGTDEESAREVFQQTFAEFGLPAVIRTDNGSPFASQGLAGLTKLSAWWMRLGITHQRIKPAHPEQNGCHERMHRTLKAETTRPAGQNSLQQQERFDAFRHEFNEERPHEALGMKRPAQLYRPSERSYPKTPPDLNYPLHDDVLEVTRAGHIRLSMGRQCFLSNALAGQPVGLREESDGRWTVTFVELDLGVYDPRNGDFEPTATSRTT